MADNYVLGMDCKLYFNPTALTTAPTGAEDWTELSNAKDLDLSVDNGEADITTRANAGWTATAPTLKTGSIDWTMLHLPGDAGFAAIQEAWLNRAEIALACMSGDIETADSEGLISNFVVINFKRNEPLDGAVTVSVSVKPSSYTDWIVIS